MCILLTECNTDCCAQGSVQSVVDSGKICILDIDVQGAQSVKKAELPQVQYVFAKAHTNPDAAPGAVCVCQASLDGAA